MHTAGRRKKAFGSAILNMTIPVIALMFGIGAPADAQTDLKIALSASDVSNVPDCNTPPPVDWVRAAINLTAYAETSGFLATDTVIGNFDGQGMSVGLTCPRIFGPRVA